jgi:hypothetical protein
MNQPTSHRTNVFSILFIFTLVASSIPREKTTSAPVPEPISSNPKIQAAILLDVSNSMDGLIDQAKSQLWNMVSVMGKVKCNDAMPAIEVALYEYGRIGNDPHEGYVKKISGFTNDLDELFRDLKSLVTRGGEEYCGHVIFSSLDQLNWDSSSASYKVIFIAGNEDFLQGDISYTKACTEAKKKGVIINTIYCGSRDQGIKEHWMLGAECSNGSFTNIDHEAKPIAIPTPYDNELIALNRKLTDTYISYGEKGNAKLRELKQTDTVPATDANDPSKIIKYRVVRSDSRFYNDSGWDLVEANEKDKSIWEKLDMTTLPDSLKRKGKEELKQFVQAKAGERRIIQKKIADLDNQRDAFIAAEKMKSKAMTSQTLETEVERIIKEQVKRFNMRIQ